MMGVMTETPASKAEPTLNWGVLVVTFLILPVGLIMALVSGQKARTAGRSQQPIWVGFAIGAVLAVIVGIALSRG